MEAVFLHSLNISITASWLIFVIILLRFLLKKAPRAFTVGMWALVGIRLICPFSVESVLSLIPSVETVPQEILTSSSPAIQSGISALNEVVNPILSGSFAPETGVSVNPMQIIAFIASIAWVVGMTVMLLYSAISYLRLRHKVKVSLLYRDNIYFCDSIHSPFILGVIKPRIYLPSGMDEEQIPYVVSHEKAHLSRKDHWWKLLGFLLLSVYWFNPIIWIAYILFCRDIEFACDEKVIKDMDNNDKRGYSETLVSCSMQRRTIMACPLAFGEVGVKDRIKSVLHYKKPAFWLVMLSIVIGVVVAVCFLTNPQKNTLQNIEKLTLADSFANTVSVLVHDGGTFYPVGEVDSELLAKLGDIEISHVEVSDNRRDDRDKSNTLVLQTEADTEPTIYSYVRGLYVCFNIDFSQVWVHTGVKPTLSYAVNHPDKASAIYHEISGNTKDISQVGGVDDPIDITTEEIDQLKEKYPQYFNLTTTKGLEVCVWQMAENSYSCGLLSGRNLGYTNEEVWGLKGTTIAEMRTILASYDIPKENVVIRAITMPHSSYGYTIDDRYRENLEKLFWGESDTENAVEDD